jgi:hypothetical protein
MYGQWLRAVPAAASAASLISKSDNLLTVFRKKANGIRNTPFQIDAPHEFQIFRTASKKQMYQQTEFIGDKLLGVIRRILPKRE